MKNSSETEPRAIASVIMWLAYLVIVYIGMTTLGTWAALVAFVVMIPLVVAMAMMWGAFNEDKDSKEALSVEEIEKRKRERIDSVLRDFSNEDLLRLKERLNDGTLNDELLYKAIIGDDGELHYDD